MAGIKEMVHKPVFERLGESQVRLQFSSQTDDVGREARARVDVQHVDLFVGQHFGGFDQKRIEREAALVVEHGLGDGRPVNLAFKHLSVHFLLLSHN